MPRVFRLFASGRCFYLSAHCALFNNGLRIYLFGSGSGGSDRACLFCGATVVSRGAGVAVGLDSGTSRARVHSLGAPECNSCCQSFSRCDATLHTYKGMNFATRFNAGSETFSARARTSSSIAYSLSRCAALCLSVCLFPSFCILSLAVRTLYLHVIVTSARISGIFACHGLSGAFPVCNSMGANSVVSRGVSFMQDSMVAS